MTLFLWPARRPAATVRTGTQTQPRAHA
jgi:hypothetical protein